MPYGSLLEDYPIVEKIGHNLGLVSYKNIDVLMAVHVLAPEVSSLTSAEMANFIDSSFGNALNFI